MTPSQGPSHTRNYYNNNNITQQRLYNYNSIDVVSVSILFNYYKHVYGDAEGKNELFERVD